MTTFALTPLVNAPSESLTGSGFSATMALIMAQCCALSYTQLSQSATPPTALTAGELSALNVASGPNATSYTFTQLSYGTNPTVMPFTGSESLGLGFTSSEPGAFVTVPFGFAAQASSSNSSQPPFNVIALRGTQTLEEWVTDTDILPTAFELYNNINPGDVPAGFYKMYVNGTDGAPPISSTNRPQGSIAQQLASLLQSSSWDKSIPLYVTGHSLGAALAVFAAMDVACNFPGSFSELYLYNFAPPNISASGILGGSDMQFATNFQQKVPNSYSVINAADIVPTLPPGTLSLGLFKPGFTQASKNLVTYCAQLQSLGNNHSLAGNYLQFVAQMANAN